MKIDTVTVRKKIAREAPKGGIATVELLISLPRIRFLEIPDEPEGVGGGSIIPIRVPGTGGTHSRTESYGERHHDQKAAIPKGARRRRVG